MMMTIESYVRQGRGTLARLAANETIHRLIRGAGALGTGLLLGGVNLGGGFQSMAAAWVCALNGWTAVLSALGGGAGYLLFWGRSGAQGLIWLALGLVFALTLGRRSREESPLLMSAAAAFAVSASGLAFQILFRDETGVPLYLLRVILAGCGTYLFQQYRLRREPAARWLVQGIVVLALARLGPAGFVAAGIIAAGGAMPGAALAGLALDLSRLTPTPMTAVLCLAYLTRLLPLSWLGYLAPGVVYLVVTVLWGGDYWLPAAGLALGGALAVLLPPQPQVSHRRGETGLAQVRLELMSGVLSQAQQLLLEAVEPPIDEGAILARTRERACGGCPCRKGCNQRSLPLPEELLHRPLTETAGSNLNCRKPGRLLLELRRSQEQYRSLRAQRHRMGEYRLAVCQQYRFLGNFLQQLADQLPRRHERAHQHFRVECAAASAGREEDNGDRFLRFTGVGCKYYILLCDGMGTGLGAAQAGQTAAVMLRQMLSAGLTAQYALESLNSLLALGEKAGAVTVDLLELELDSGQGTVYKWGAAPSYLLRQETAEKIGTAGPPPGLSVETGRGTTHRLSLRRGEVLVLTSDGVDGEEALRRMDLSRNSPPGELAARLLQLGIGTGEDDATAAVVRLVPEPLST